MKTLTVFTPTYNRAHTLERTYQSLCRQTCKDFEWMVIDDGSTDGTKELVEQFIREDIIPIHYIYKENGGLYTGYNVAYETIKTELNVCVDSDDFMPDNAVELIVDTWKEKGARKYAGIIGLDYDFHTQKPIGGGFPEDLKECYFPDLALKKIHMGDTKQVLRTDLMRSVAPQVGFPGEKNFNPIYMILQVCDKYPLLVLNKNLCIVDYQLNDSMSKAIFQQYINSPRSFVKLRIMEMQMEHNTWRNKIRLAVHYVAESLIAKDEKWFKKSPCKILTLCVWPIGFLLYKYILLKNKKDFAI